MSQLKKYKRLKYLGKGSYGAAILVELRSNPSQRFVIKEIVIGHLKPAEQAAAKSEAEVLHQMNHSNITMYIESFVENAKLYIVMENADGGDLSTAIQNRRKEMKYWDEEEVMRIFVQICLALKHVHNQNILHRDLKSQNIFLTLKGVVKLGDFGIAKVLDATDDQARTQIGTPYYLSPEICESKPYGRESDVWSLGVLLYELIALEMPFQATSLPALVHRICVAEPNYSVIEKRYSSGLINLTKSMLMKDPQKRPSVSQIVRSDFIKTHISRLLSYTLKVGNGGVDGGKAPVLPPAVRPSNVHNLDAEEAERCIESVHSQIRDQESKEVRSQSDREASRIAEREKLRKFRSDMARVRKDSDSDVRVPEEGKDGSAYRNGARAVSPKGARAYSPKNGRPLSPKNARAISPKGRAISPKGRDISPKAPRNVSPKGGRSVSPLNAPRPYGAAEQRALTPRSHAAMQAQKEKDRKVAAAAAMKKGFSREESVYESREMRYQQQQQQQQQVVVTRNSGANEYESAARREFFANRAAAQAVKAKVEAYERNGGERVHMPLIGGGGYAPGAGAGAVVAGGVRSHPSSRRGSEVDRDYNYAAEESSLYEPSAYRGARHSSVGDDASDAERRIAQIKLQRERDREKENAIKEMQLKEALEANRDARRQAQGMKSAIAFDIDLGGAGNAAPKVRNPTTRQSLDEKSGASASPKTAHSPHSAAAARAQRSVRDDKDTPSMESDSGKGRSKKSWGPPVSGGEIAKGVVRYSDLSTPTSQMFAPPAAAREGNSSRLSNAGSARERCYDDDSNSNAATEVHVAGHQRDYSRDSIESMPIEEDQVVMRRLESKRISQAEARSQAKEVFRKLREKRRKESELKGKRSSVVVEHEVVSPVKKQNPEGVANHRAANASPMQLRLMEVLNQVDSASEFAMKVSAAAPDSVRMRSNSEAPPSTTPSTSNTPSRKSYAGSETPTRKPPSGAQSRDAKEVPSTLDRHVEEEDDDLEYTLDNWLTQQKRGVTQRKKNGSAYPAPLDSDLEDVAGVDDGIDGYSTIKKGSKQAKDSGDEVDEEGMDFYISGTYRERNDSQDDDRADSANSNEAPSSKDHNGDGVVRGKYMGNDVEVVGLQCMLAQALMGEGDEDD